MGNIAQRERISIHALREEGDLTVRCRTPCLTNFYPRPPRGGRPRTAISAAKPVIFLSTPSARRATPRLAFLAMAGVISIHALREEGDGFADGLLFCKLHFYPRPPRGGRLASTATSPTNSPISIHALREEGDRFVH